MTDTILALNVGSSSLKFALFSLNGDPCLTPILRGGVERLAATPRLTMAAADGTPLADAVFGGNDGNADVLPFLLNAIESKLEGANLLAVGHRVVHGGRDFTGPRLVTAELLEDLDGLVALAPLHEAQNIAPMRTLRRLRPQLVQVACFDTAFHSTMPEIATRFGLPRAYEAMGVRRYGFHGLSYEYVSGRMQDIAPDLSNGRVIAAHLGNGASLCALLQGRSIDTTMGFSALDGLLMGTRPGTLDPGVILHLLQRQGMTAAQIEDLLYHRCGLLGVSGGIASDMRELLASMDASAREAVELFAYRCASQIGALAAALNGLDGLVFTAGIGEHSPEIRKRVCDRLRWLGVRINEEANDSNAPLISTGASTVEVRIVPTDEEAMIARHTLAKLKNRHRAHA
ncbi:MAG: acetate/propionate family kinase [Aquamicrobium sp.]|nr:acetate/propionate family kinase [Aquamicrobium sp.]